MNHVLSTASPGDRARYASTLARMEALRTELWHMAEEYPPLVRKVGNDPDQVGPILVAMLLRLCLQQAGAFARLGKENESAWAAVNDRLENLVNISDIEKQRMGSVCAYIRQMSMFSSGIEELLGVQP